MKKVIPMLTIILLLGISPLSFEALASNKDELNEFLKTIHSSNYQEFKNATGNIRTSIKYQDLKQLLKEEGILNSISESTYRNPNINPETNIYFYASWKELDKQFLFKYAIYDSKSKKILVSGSHTKTKK
ncbi:hypothetical protein [Bacillus sp. AG4(2022)]|uniref:hypothetical protein n=1 Tax=Bacillus sp. AG4(2022) TaxID=2962594 RepID=UPI0028813908|nr:hypothetical protein [Bacillus sp. AG4(2022)]MDT0163602.1 hypothetical protein [Bacillus sp. AG4(2022)]